ncbi:Sphingolipid long chain base-responsive protein LSP1 [Penicillium chermesinum]|nr:Sphingolipid long chain base-responsive protein LSP1 [Penicillium chermesinum]
MSFRPRHRDTSGGGPNFITNFRGLQGPELSRKMARLLKTENTVINAHETAGRSRTSVASQLSEWGESTGDDTISDISDKMGVLLAEIGDQEGFFAQNLEDSRAVLKHIRNMESSVQPSRDQRQKATDEIAKLKFKDPNSPRLATLEHELVRAEAQNLVAEAQLSNTIRSKLKEAFDLHTAAVIERAEKQIILARHARRLLEFVDDTPMVPGDARHAYDRQSEARQVLEDAETDLRAWKPSVEPLASPEALAEEGETREVERDSVSITSEINDAGVNGITEEVSSVKIETEAPTAVVV